MADFVLRRASRLPARTAFARLVDWDAHSAAIPLTRLRYEGVPRVGQRFVARTGVGRFGFDDVMVVDVLEPPSGDLPGDEPGRVTITKHGRVVGGTVGWKVAPTAAGSAVTWTQHLVIPWLPLWMDGVVGAVGSRAYGMGLRRLVG
jgi:hypothetical protein